MRKVKLDATSEKPAGVFIYNETPRQNEALRSVKGAKISEIGKDGGPTDRHRRLVSILKQVFLFLPGTFLLFFMSCGAAIIVMEIVVYGRTLETLPNDSPWQFALMGAMIVAGTVMTWFGLGDTRNRKHFVIPALLILTGAIAGALIKAASVSDLAGRMLDDFSYLIWLLPLALVVAVLAKGVVGQNAEGA